MAIHGEENTSLTRPEDEKFSRELNAALAKLTTAKPRTGIEERILSNLRSECARETQHGSWRWPLAASLAAVMLAAIIAAGSPRWRSGSWSNSFSAHAPQNQQTNGPVLPQVSNEPTVAAGHRAIQHQPLSARRRKVQAVSLRGAKVAITHKLDQFPSPEALSEQEKILTEYVSEHRKQAVLLARDQMAQFKQDLAEETEALDTDSLTQDQPAPNQDR